MNNTKYSSRSAEVKFKGLHSTYHFTSLEGQLVFLHNVDSHFLRQKRLTTIVLYCRSNVQIRFGNDSGL